MTEALARVCARHPWRTIAAWVGAIIVAIGLVATLLPGSLSTEGRVTNNPESLRAGDLLAERVLRQEGFSELVIIRSERSTVSDPAFQSEVRRLATAATSTGAIAAAALYYQTRDPSLVSPDRHALLVPLRTDAVERLIALVEREDGVGGFQVALTGEDTTNHDFNELSQHDLKAGELSFGMPAAMLVLVLVFGALVAATLPLLLAIVSIIVALGLTAVVAHGYSDLSVFAVNMLTGMGLALGIDYALFVVSRFREERAYGREKLDAIGVAGATASRAVLFSGTAFILAMTGMLLVESTIMRSLAIGAILVAFVSIAAALTLMPAVLSLLGDRVNRLRVPGLGRQIDSTGESRFWTGVVTRVIRHPVLSLVAAVALLLVAASPLLGMKIGAAGISTLPDSFVSKRGFLALERSFPTAGAYPAQVVIAGKVASPKVRDGIARLQRELASDQDFGSPTLTSEPSRDIALLSVPVAADAVSDRAVDAVKKLRFDYVPRAFDSSGAEVLVGGTTAENIDYFAVMRHWLPLTLVFVLGLSFVLLTLVFRSIVIAATSIAVNLLSVSAAYGLLVLVFQNGVGSGLFGFQQIDRIEAWVPLFLFAVLFGLSMDYQVFLLSRIQERWRRTGDTTDAIVFGIGSTARIITGAALIIVAVFAGFAAGDLVMFQQMGFGIAVALLIDATIVRSVLVPAVMKLWGDRNWYLPHWLEWLPHVEVESSRRVQPS